jgi:hypothetical protein
MNSDNRMLDEKWFSEGAFMLLTSSSLARYVRMAGLLAQDSGLRTRIKSGELTISAVLQRAKSLWRKVLGSKQREIAEVELAAILAAIGESPCEQVSDFLVQVSMIDQPSVAWLSALARRLNRARPTNQMEIVFSKESEIKAEITCSNRQDHPVGLEHRFSTQGIYFSTYNKRLLVA